MFSYPKGTISVESKFYTADQIAEYFGVRVETIRDWIKRGLLSGFKAGRDWRFTQEDVDACVEKLRAQTAEMSMEEKKLAVEQRQPGFLAMLERARELLPYMPETELEEFIKSVIETTFLNPHVRVNLVESPENISFVFSPQPRSNVA